MRVSRRMPGKGYSFATWLRIEEGGPHHTGSCSSTPRAALGTATYLAGTPAPVPPPGVASASTALPGSHREPDRALYTLLARDDDGGVKGFAAAFRGAAVLQGNTPNSNFKHKPKCTHSAVDHSAEVRNYADLRQQV